MLEAFNEATRILLFKGKEGYSSTASIIEKFRERDIFSFNESDRETIQRLFLDSLPILENRDGYRSPVSVGKLLPLLAGEFFPFWDNNIARAYRCWWYGDHSFAAKKYVDFMRKMKVLSENVLKDCMYKKNIGREAATEYIRRKCSEWGCKRPFLKIIDEYNYAKYTKRWI